MNTQPLTTTQDRPDYIRQLLLSGVLAMVIVLCFKSGVTGTFIFDDRDAIINNETIHSGSLWQILMTKRDAPISGRPLSNLCFAINYAVSGDNPQPYHWFNIIFQVCVGWMLLALMRRILPLCILPRSIDPVHSDWLAAGITLLWAIHPVQSECVMYITQRTEQFAMMSMVLAFYGLVRHHQSQNRQSRWLWLSFLACTVGMLFKQNASIYPLLLILADRALLAGTFTEVFKLRGRFHLLTLLCTWAIAIGILIYDPNPASTGYGHGVNAWDYLMTQSQVLVHYLKNCFVPTSLCLYYDWPIVSRFQTIALPFTFISLLFALSCYCLWKHPKAGLAMMGVFLILGPTSSILPMVTEVAADRRLSLISILLLTLGVVLMYRILLGIKLYQPIATGITLAIVLLTGTVYSAMTARLSVYYANTVNLWSYTIDTARQPQAAWEQLGSAYERQNQLAPAWQCYRTALSLEPGYNIARLNLGLVMAKLGQNQEAIRLFEIESQNPYHGSLALLYMGAIHKSEGKYDKALDCFQRAYKREPQNIDIALNLARTYNLHNQFNEARMVLESLSNQYPDEPVVLQDLGYTYSNLGLLEEAQGQYEHYLLTHPDDAKVLNSMGVVMAKQGKLTQAAAYFARALSIDPQLQEARDNLQKARQQIK